MIDESQFPLAIPQKYSTDVVFIHSCFMSLFSGMLNWVGDVLYPKISYKVITTYDKAVEVFRKKQTNPDGLVNSNFLPALTLDPILDFSNEERAGRFYWMFKNLDNRWDLRPWKSIKLIDQGVRITPMFTRYQGTVELTAWLQSIYEYIDFRTKLIQFCGGYQRWIRPECFWTHMILPKEIFEAHGDQGPVNWDAINPDVITLETTATKEYALPFQLDAIWRLDSCSDGSTKMGADQICEFKCNASFTWECNIPTFIRFEDYMYPIETINLNVGMTPVQAKYPLRTGWDIFQKIDPYRDVVLMCNSRAIWNIDEKDAKPSMVFDDTMCKCYPTQYLDYNHYVVGKMYDVTKLKSVDEIESVNSILIIDKYKEEYLPYVRKCRGLISHYDNDKSAKLMNLVENYHISYMYDINNLQLFNTFKKLHGKIVTFDVLGKVLYLGEKKVKRWTAKDDFADFVFNHNLINMIKKFNLEKDLKKEYMFSIGDINFHTLMSVDPVILCQKFTAKKDQHEFELPFMINDNCHRDFSVKINSEITNRYKIDLDKIILENDVKIKKDDIVELYRNINTTITSLRLVCNHYMTKEDEVNYIQNDKLIEVNLDNLRIDNYDNIYCVSYCGLMNKDRDFVINEKNKTLTFKIEPHRDCYIQIYTL